MLTRFLDSFQGLRILHEELPLTQIASPRSHFWMIMLLLGIEAP